VGAGGGKADSPPPRHISIKGGMFIISKQLMPSLNIYFCRFTVQHPALPPDAQKEGEYLSASCL